MVTRMSNAVENKLMTILTKVAEVIGDDLQLDPNDVIVKVAGGSLRSGEVDVLVRAFNAGRTNMIREQGGSLQEKVAEFQLADADTIRKKMQTSDPSKKVASESVPFRTAAEVASIIRNQRDVHVPAGMQKAAREVSALQSVIREVEPAVLVKRAREACTLAERNLVSAIDKLGAVFRQGLSQPAVKAAAATLLGEDAVEHVFESMYASQPGLRQIRSYTDQGLNLKIAVSHPAIAAVSEVVEAAKVAYLALQRKTAADSLVASVTRVASQLQEGYSLFDPQPVKSAIMSVGDVISRSGKAISDLRNFGDARTNMDAAVNKTLEDLTDPDHEENLRRLQAQTSLQELLASDEVIRGYTPEAVTGAYSRVTQTAPLLASSTIALQPFLRRQLEQGGRLDTFDVNDMLNMNNALQQRFSAMNDAPASSR